MTTATADAYSWTKKQPDPLPPVEEVEDGQEGGLDGTIDEAVKGLLNSTGILDQLEKVTGMPAQLSTAANAWHSQAKSLHSLADALRMGAAKLPGHWEGDASEHFGHGMGKLVHAIDASAHEMGQTAHILSGAAKECKLAEDTVIGIIRELIEWAVIEIAAMVALDIITLGIGTVVDALIADATVEVFIARVSRVVAKLGKALEELMKEVRELRKAEGAIAKAKGLGTGLLKAQKVTSAGGIMGPGKEGGSFLARQGAWLAQHELYGQFKKHVVEPVTGVEPDPVGPAKETLVSDTAKQSLARDLDPPQSHPYHVDKRSIEEDFG